MSYFNDEQRSEMEHLASLKPEERCWCGWFLVGKCGAPNPCPPEATMADRKKETCECGNYPGKPGLPLYHRYGCNRERHTQDEQKVIPAQSAG